MKVLKYGIINFMLSNYLVKGVAYLTQLLLIYFLAIEDVGYIRLSLSYYELFNIVCGLGLTTSLLKVNSNKALSDNEKGKNLFLSVGITILFSLFIIAVVNLIAEFGLFSDIEEVNHLVQLLSFTLLINSVLNLFIIDFQVTNRYTDLAKSQAISKLVAFFLFVPLVYLWGVNGYILSVYIGFILTLIVLFLYGVSMINNDINYSNFSLKDYSDFFSKYFHISFYALLSNVFGVFNKYIGLYIVGYMSVDQKEFGMYSIALTFLVLLEIITYTLQQYFVPQFSAKSNNNKKWKDFFRKTEKQSQLFQLLVFVITNALCYVVIFQFFPMYKSVAYYFFVISISWLISTLYTMKGPGLISLGRTKYNFYSSVIALPLVFSVSIPLVMYYGVWGVAMSKVAQALISMVTANYFFKLTTNSMK
ncbi:oligosaccharide flippase family protein [Vibrio alginolyticus]